jgi:hypothetical protein
MPTAIAYAIETIVRLSEENARLKMDEDIVMAEVKRLREEVEGLKKSLAAIGAPPQ